MYEDARGGHVEVPQAAAPDFEFFHRMNELRKAYFQHLNPTNMDAPPTTSTEYVALHHFHPRVVRKLADAAGGRLLQVPQTFRLEDTQRLGWEPTEADRVYNIQGQRTEDFYFVPSYPIEFAYRDLKQLAKAERFTQEVSTDVYQKAKLAIQARKEQEHKDNRKKRRHNKHRRETREDGATQASHDSRNRSAPTSPLADPTKGAPLMEVSKEKLPENLLVDTSKAVESGQPSSHTMEQPKDTSMDASGALEGSFSIFATFRAPTNKLNASFTQDDLGASDATVPRYRTLSASQNDLGTSNATVTHRTSTSTNLDASAISLQITDPSLMQGSSSNFHASDLTVPASNLAPARGNGEEPFNAADEFPLEEMPRRPICTALPACETKTEYGKRTRASASMTVPRIATILESAESHRGLMLKDSEHAPVGGASMRFAEGKSEKKMDCSPATPRRMVSERELGTDPDFIGKKLKEETLADDGLNEKGEEEEEIEIEEESSKKPALRSGSAARLSLLEKRKRFPQTTSAVRDGSSVTRSSSGHSAYDGRRKSDPTRRSRSFCSAGVRRSSDTSLFTPEVASKLSTYKRIDSTFRSLQRFSHDADQKDETHVLGPHNPRRAFPKSRRSRSDSPTAESRQGRRLAIVASDGNELIKKRGFRRNGGGSPRRTKSHDAMPKPTLKRSSDPSPSRSASPNRSLRRTRSGAPSDRISRRARIEQGKQSSQSSLSPKRSAIGANRGLSPKIKRIDTSKRAMEKFIQDANASTDLSAELSPREALKRTCSKMGPQRGLSPPRDLSPVPVRSMLPFRRTGTRGLNTSLSELDNSAPGALEHGRDRFHGSMNNLMSGSAGETRRLYSSLGDLNVLSPTSNNSKASVAADDTTDIATSERALHGKGSSDSSLMKSAPDVAATEEEGNEANESAIVAAPESDTQKGTGVGKEAVKVTSIETPTPPTDSSQQQEHSGLQDQVDWESMGFSSSTSGPMQIDDDLEGSSTFELPLRLLGKRCRQQLLAEVVISANQRQSTLAGEQRKAEQVVLTATDAILATVIEEEPEGPEVSQPRQSLLQQRPSWRLDDSSMSLSLGKVFGDKDSDHAASFASGSNYDFEGSGCMSSEQLRTLFPFKAIQKKRKSSGQFRSPHALPSELQKTSKVQELPTRPLEKERLLGDDDSESSSDMESFVGDSNTVNEETDKACTSADSSPLPALVPMTDCLDGENHGRRLARSHVPAPYSSDEDSPSSSTSSESEVLDGEFHGRRLTKSFVPSPYSSDDDTPSSSTSSGSEVASIYRHPYSSTSSGSEAVSSDESISFKLAVPLFATKAQQNDCISNRSGEGSSGGVVSDPIKEFNLSFPPKMALASRALPPSFDCLGHKDEGNEPMRVRRATNGLLGSDELDNKIEISFRKLDMLPRDIHVAGGPKDTSLEKKGGGSRQKAGGATTSSKVMEPDRPPAVIDWVIG